MRRKKKENRPLAPDPVYDSLLAARLTARFGHGRDAAEVEVSVTDIQGTTRAVRVAPMPANEIPPEWYL